MHAAFHCCFIGVKNSHADHCSHCAADAGCFIRFCSQNRKSEHICCDLTDFIALRSAPSDCYGSELAAAALFDMAHAVDQCKVDAFHNCPVEMSSGVHIAEADDCASCGRHRDVRSKVWLHDQSVAARRDQRQAAVQNLFCGDAEFLCLFHLVGSKFFLEPRNQPVPAEDFDLRIPLSRNHTRVGRNESFRFLVSFRHIGNRSGCA